MKKSPAYALTYQYAFVATGSKDFITIFTSPTIAGFTRKAINVMPKF